MNTPFHPAGFLAFFMIATALCSPAQADTPGTPLTDPEIEMALTNAATKGVNSYGNPYTVWFLAGGRLDGIAGKNDEYVDSGEWWLEDNFLCRRWNTWLGGSEGCFQVVIIDTTIYWLTFQGEISREEEYIAPQ